MIVHKPTKSIENGFVSISAAFEMDTPIPYLPRFLWYRFPKQYANRTNSRADGFAPTALLVAMYTGEDLDLQGVISPRLAYHLYEYMEIFHSWDPKIFGRINIHYDQLEASSPAESEIAVGTAFSGGVDSFYTLQRHLPENQPIPQARVTHGLFIHGLDLRLEDRSNYEAAARPYTRLFEDQGLELIQASTNAYQFSEFRINWTMFCGAPLIGAALLLGPWMNRFYIPSAMFSYLELSPLGTSPLIDHLLSTEVTEIVHHGTAVDRLEKLELLTKWPATYHKLRVCSDKIHIHGLNNCSFCHKCYRTMTMLGLLDALPNYSNFSRKMKPGDFLRWAGLTHLEHASEDLIRGYALRKGRIGMVLWMQVVIILQILKSSTIMLLKSFLSREQLYRLKRKAFMPETSEE